MDLYYKNHSLMHQPTPDKCVSVNFSGVTAGNCKRLQTAKTCICLFAQDFETGKKLNGNMMHSKQTSFARF